VVDKDWPPPHREPLGTAVFEEVAYIQLPTSADHFHRVVAWHREGVEAHRPSVCAGLAIGRGEVEPGPFLIALEPESSDEAPGYVVAKSLRTKRGLFAR
jgi:hypothetical protein